MNKILMNAIQERYGSISELVEAMRECTLTVCVNLEDDIKMVMDCNEIEESIYDYLNKIKFIN